MTAKRRTADQGRKRGTGQALKATTGRRFRVLCRKGDLDDTTTTEAAAQALKDRHRSHAGAGHISDIEVIESGKGASSRARRAPNGDGPVTLAEARALALGRRPQRRGTGVSALGASPASLGLERQSLEVKREQERRRRIQDYVSTLTIMKRRGVRGLTRGARRGAGSGAAAEARPLQLFAEGDSWFDYPFPFFGGGIIPRLEDKLGVPILNLAEAGDEVRYMLGVKQRRLLTEQLLAGCPAGGPWDAVLFSGGGNDIVDNPMALWIRDFNPALPPSAQIHKTRFAAAMALVRAGYEDLIELRDRLSPVTHLFFHTYDFAIPDGRGACHLGPWLKPTFDLHGFPTQASAFEVMRLLLQEFAAMLSGLQAMHPRVTVIATQGTLAPAAKSWHNELHPSSKSFTTLASLFHAALKSAFPSQVP